jgi:hypothetical protein
MHRKVGIWNQLHWCCSPSLIWRVWSCKKVSYYPKVVFSMIWHFGLTCCITKVFQEYGLFWCSSHFVYTMKIHMSERTVYSEEICLQRHTIWSSKSVRFHHDVFYHIIRYEARTATQCVYALLHWYVQFRLPQAKLWMFHMIGYLSLQHQNTCFSFWFSSILIAIRIGIQSYKLVWFYLLPKVICMGTEEATYSWRWPNCTYRCIYFHSLCQRNFQSKIESFSKFTFQIGCTPWYEWFGFKYTAWVCSNLGPL